MTPVTHLVWVTDARIDFSQSCAGNEPHVHEYRSPDRNPNEYRSPDWNPDPPPAPEAVVP